MEKGLYSCDLVKDLERGRLFQIIHMGLKCNYIYLYKTEEERDVNTERRRGENGEERFEDAGLGVMWPQNKNSILNFKFTE